MYTLEERHVMDLGDIYTLLYGYLGQELINQFHLDGECALREASRRFGRDRGKTLREKHLRIGAKVNMQNLFSLYPDLPSDPRFRRELQILAPQERISHTLYCPMAAIWEKHGQKNIGRIYCEEFHPACYSEYAYGYTHVNLARTQTQGDDPYCAFRVILRPADLPEDLRGECFAEFDADYKEPPYHPELSLSGREGFEMLAIKLYHYLLETSVEYMGTGAISAVAIGLQKLSKASVELLKETSSLYHVPFDDDLVAASIPFSHDYDSISFWQGYDSCNAKLLLEENFFKPLFKEAGH